MAGSGLFYLGLGLAAIAWCAGELRTLERAPAPVLAAAAPPVPGGGAIIGGSLAEVAIPRAPDGKFYAEATVNGTSVRFLVDTGATGIVMTADDARRVGLGTGDYSAEGRGAGGIVRLRPVTLQRLAVGTLAADNLAAMVAEDQLPVSLLGQTWLARVSSVTIAGDRMVLR